uniref:Uncharacterized protein n=1 Tax=Rhizophora mucronata TaxID=61149 RepID=A0A2P2IVR5_RHIMU
MSSNSDYSQSPGVGHQIPQHEHAAIPTMALSEYEFALVYRFLKDYPQFQTASPI